MPRSPGYSRWNSRCCSRSVCRLMPVSNFLPIFGVGGVSSTCLVSADRNRTSVPAEWTGKVVSVRISAHGIRVVADGALVARHEGQVRAQPVDLRAPVYEELGIISPFWRPNPVRLTSWAPVHRLGIATCGGSGSGSRAQTGQGGSRLRRPFAGRPRDRVGALDVACQLAQEQGHLNTSVVLNELRRLTSPPRGPQDGNA